MNFVKFVSLFAFASFMLLSCDQFPVQPDECDDGWGTLSVTNKSLHTVQKVRIDGTNYGSIDPGENKTIDLPVGTYTLEINGISGGSGCNPSEVTVPDCGTVGRSCSY